MTRQQLPVCDATLSGLPVGECSPDRVQVWHGLSDPAISCGRHSHGPDGYIAGPPIPLFRGHRVRLGLAQPWSDSDVIREVRP